MKILSSSFQNGAPIPPKFTCDGEDVNPELAIQDVPANAITLALIMDDPDASRGYTFTHWLIWNISKDMPRIPEGSVPSACAEGKNDFPMNGYGGPCPPAGKSHRYFFRLYALDAKLDLQVGASREELEAAMAGHVIDTAGYMGTYGLI